MPNKNEEVLAAIAALDAKVTALSAAQAAQGATLSSVSASVARANQKIRRVEELTLQAKIEVTN